MLLQEVCLRWQTKSAQKASRHGDFRNYVLCNIIAPSTFRHDGWEMENCQYKHHTYTFPVSSDEKFARHLVTTLSVRLMRTASRCYNQDLHSSRLNMKRNCWANGLKLECTETNTCWRTGRQSLKDEASLGDGGLQIERATVILKFATWTGYTLARRRLTCQVKTMDECRGCILLWYPSMQVMSSLSSTVGMNVDRPSTLRACQVGLQLRWSNLLVSSVKLIAEPRVMQSRLDFHLHMNICTRGFCISWQGH